LQKPRANISSEMLGNKTADSFRSLSRRIGIAGMQSLGIKPPELDNIARYTVNNGRFSMPGAQKPDFDLVLKILKEEYNS
jgi:hypothetical protein